MTSWVSTLRQAAEVTLTDNRVIAGEIHLQPYAENHMGPERPVDMLNRAEGFFAVSLAGGAPVFLAKAHVIVVTLEAQPSIDDPDRASAARSMSLELELTNGSLLEGLVSFELPPDRGRALDFLNIAPSFFSVWTPDAVRLINRAHVRAASPL